jgi:hypothetical protein
VTAVIDERTSGDLPLSRRRILLKLAGKDLGPLPGLMEVNPDLAPALGF